MKSLSLAPCMFVLALITSGTWGEPLRFKKELKGLFGNGSSPIVEKLFQKTTDNQRQHDVPWVQFITWHQAKGLYSSNVKLNFHGNVAQSTVRRSFNVYDNNLFATAWITSNLLEAYKYGGAPKPSDHQIDIALQTFPVFSDKNVDYKTSCMAFWSQEQNKTTQSWRSTPDNLFNLIKSAVDFPIGVFTRFLKFLGLEHLADELKFFLAESDLFLRAFRVPPDFDDTFLNLAVGASLYDQRSEFKSGWNIWNNNNQNLSSVFDALKKYAYRPFSTDPNENTVDPRTYYYIRGFLNEAHANEEPIALVTTWIQNIEELRKAYGIANQMPFQLNNVDLTVSANVVYGLTHATLSGLVDKSVLQDSAIAQIYLNTTSLIAYEIDHNLMGRPDLALTYYPPQIEFYWFVSRTLNILETARRSGHLPVAVMENIYKILSGACEGRMTKYVVEHAIADKSGLFYFDDFLGDGDVDIFNRTVKRGEDRIFTTAMAANALLYTWTYFDESTGKVYWKKGVAGKVQGVVEGAIKWLAVNTLSGHYEPWNAFFSGSVKGFGDLPFWFPGNRFEFLNGTKIKDWSHIPNETFVYGVQGYIPDHDYEKMIKEKHFGYKTPTVFEGYNGGNSTFPFWNSIPFTYSSAMIAISRFQNIHG